MEDILSGFKCMIAISSQPDAQGLVYLGEPFMRAFNTAFNYDPDMQKVYITLNPANDFG